MTACSPRVSLIGEGHGRRVRMGNLAFVGSHKVNGVSALHTGLMRQTVFRDFNTLFPGRIVNKTNGISFRRWLFQCNPGLTALLVEALGPRVLDDAASLADLRALSGDAAFRGRFAAVKRANKEALAVLIREQTGVQRRPGRACSTCRSSASTNTSGSCSISCRRWRCTRRCAPSRCATGRRAVKIFAGKAAPGYHRAKLIIKLAWDVARMVNRDPAVRGLLKVAFLPNYNVSAAEVIVPAADLSEQISTAGMEASGTGNMKLALNGALTIGTLDGATVEMADHIGARAHVPVRPVGRGGRGAARRGLAWRGGGGAVRHAAARCWTRSATACSRRMIAAATATWSPRCAPRTGSWWRPISTPMWPRSIVRRRCIATRTPGGGTAVLNTAGMGWFSSDRSIAEYAAEIWKVPAAP